MSVFGIHFAPDLPSGSPRVGDQFEQFQMRDGPQGQFQHPARQFQFVTDPAHDLPDVIVPDVQFRGDVLQGFGLAEQTKNVFFPLRKPYPAYYTAATCRGRNLHAIGPRFMVRNCRKTEDILLIVAIVRIVM